MAINERFCELLKSKNISVKEAASIIGKSDMYVRKLMRTGESFGIEPAMAILNSMKDISADWLLTGEGSMLKSSTAQKEVKEIQPESVMMVPLVSQYAHAGYMAGFADGVYMESLPKIPWPMDEEHHGEYVCFEVRGDSMDDGMRHSYAQGDIVLCRNVDRLYWQKRLHFKQWNAFVIVHKEGIVLKQIVAHDVEKGVITVHSFNPYYEDFDIDLRDVYQILNVVKTQRNG